jgi:hypothetical protein
LLPGQAFQDIPLYQKPAGAGINGMAGGDLHSFDMNALASKRRARADCYFQDAV